jgi:hypothetical protein
MTERRKLIQQFIQDLDRSVATNRNKNKSAVS